MTAFKFLSDYINGEATVCISNDKGSIRYEGKLNDMPRWVISHMEFVSIEGLGSKNDLIITVRG